MILLLYLYTLLILSCSVFPLCTLKSSFIIFSSYLYQNVFNYFLYLFLATVLLDCSSFMCICFLFTRPHLKVSLFHLLFILLICNQCSSETCDLSNVLPTLPVLLLFPNILLKRTFILTNLKLHYACLHNFLLNFPSSVASHLMFPLIYLSVPSIC